MVMLRQLFAGTLILVTSVASADDAPVFTSVASADDAPVAPVAVALPVVKVEDPAMAQLRAENAKLKADKKASDKEKKAAESKQNAYASMYAPATSCKTVKELLKWRKGKDEALARVPSAFQAYPRTDNEEQFAKQLDALIEEATEANEIQSAEDIADVKVARDMVAAKDKPEPPQPVPSVQLPAAVPTPSVELRNTYAVPVAEATAEFPQDCAVLTRTAILRTGSLAEIPVLIMQSDMCTTPEDVAVWQACQLAEIHQHVPANYRDSAAKHVMQQVESRLAQVLGHADAASLPQADTFPVFLAIAQQCKTEPELRAWHENQIEQAKSRFQDPFTGFAIGALDGTFQGRLADLVQQRQQMELRQRSTYVVV